MMQISYELLDDKIKNDKCSVILGGENLLKEIEKVRENPITFLNYSLSDITSLLNETYIS